MCRSTRLALAALALKTLAAALWPRSILGLRFSFAILE